MGVILCCGCTALLVRADDSGATNEGIMSVVNANNLFALSLYPKITSSESGNVFFSPYSISTAMSMVYEGVNGSTADEISSVFHFPLDSTIRHSSIAAIYNSLNSQSSNYVLRTANALWVQENYSILNNFSDIARNYYAGEAMNLDFISNTEQSRSTINSWVEENTNKKIVNLIPVGSLNELTRLVLTNAIYFKGKWFKQFDTGDTHDADFMLSNNDTVTVKMMSLSETELNYAEAENLKILEMTYKDNNLSMIVLLPNSNDLTELESSLTLENLNYWKSLLVGTKVDVYLPKFTFDTKYYLNSVLSEMGMPSAFTPYVADLSGIDGTHDLYITFVIHQAFVAVDEEGTEAAAATAIGVGMTAMPIMHVFRADHPFIFLIQDRVTGNILFLGRVMNPLE
jgi:serpin B